MKSVQLVLFLTTFLISLIATQPVKSNDFLMIATAICEYTKANDRSKIRKKLKRAKLKIRKIYKDIRCNDKSLHAFAKEHNADEVIKYYETSIKAADL